MLFHKSIDCIFGVTFPLFISLVLAFLHFYLNILKYLATFVALELNISRCWAEHSLHLMCIKFLIKMFPNIFPFIPITWLQIDSSFRKSSILLLKIVGYHYFKIPEILPII